MNYLKLRYRVEACIRLTPVEVTELCDFAHEYGEGKYDDHLSWTDDGFLGTVHWTAHALLERDRREYHDFWFSAFEIEVLNQIVESMPKDQALRWQAIAQAYARLRLESKSLNNLSEGDRLL